MRTSLIDILGAIAILCFVLLGAILHDTYFVVVAILLQLFAIERVIERKNKKDAS